MTEQNIGKNACGCPGDSQSESSAERKIKPDIQAIMADIRARVKADVENSKDARRPFKSYSANSNNQASRQAGELLHSEDLRFLNTNHAYSTAIRSDSITTHRKGIIGKILVRAKQKFMRVMRQSIFRDYFTSEAEFSLNLVRFLNDVSKYVDARDGTIFWELIRKVDHDVTGAMERIERINDEQMAALRSSEKQLTENFNQSLREISQRVGETQAKLAQHADQLKTLDSVARGLEGLVAKISAPKQIGVNETSQSDVGSIEDASYVLLENRYRGSEAEIKERLEIYPALFKAARNRVLEIGPGRGELLTLFREAGIPAYGVDCDQGMVAQAKDKGLEVSYGDGLRHLTSISDGGIGGVIAIQVVEHLSMRQLKDLFELCARKVEKGGRIVFETINPRSLTALSSNYFRDPSHVWPLHPDTLSYAMTLAGLKVLEVRMLSPIPEEAMLRPVPIQEYMTPRWHETVELINYNMKQLNDLLYGYQDYCVIAEAA